MSVERYVKFSKVVNKLEEAWVFVMQHVEILNADPQIIITPMWIYGDDDSETRGFEVSVAGTEELGDDDE